MSFSSKGTNQLRYSPSHPSGHTEKPFCFWLVADAGLINDWEESFQVLTSFQDTLLMYIFRLQNLIYTISLQRKFMSSPGSVAENIMFVTIHSWFSNRVWNIYSCRIVCCHKWNIKCSHNFLLLLFYCSITITWFSWEVWLHYQALDIITGEKKQVIPNSLFIRQHIKFQ